jgi:wyosine [tRNA(Phe)-imidazoG37] synthetase (radical SAM superfamily)
VPDLSRGPAPAIELPLLREELDHLLSEILEGRYLEASAPPEHRVLKDISISGDGEPSSCRQFAEVAEVIADATERHDLLGKIRLVLITNGTFVHRPEVLRGLDTLAACGGELWFKVDGGSEERRHLVNDASVREATLLENMKLASDRIRLRVQSCVFELDRSPPSVKDRRQFVELLERARDSGVKIDEVMLYTLARATHQPEASRLAKVGPRWLESFAGEVAAAGFEVSAHA